MTQITQDPWAMNIINLKEGVTDNPQIPPTYAKTAEHAQYIFGDPAI